MTRINIDNSIDIIDTRDVIERIEQLEEAELDAKEDGVEFEDVEELTALINLRDALENECDWEDGTTLIRESYFATYAEEFAEEFGTYDPNASWPYNCIDWERAAREFQVDYTAHEWGGVTYWFRN